jgi:tryptophanyl-tRNA synthetase
MSKEVILTGLRANGEFHLGNYLGAIQPMVDLQKKHTEQYQINMFIPDLHSFTTPIEHENLYENTINNLKNFVAAGLDINNPDTFIYRQSYIPAHSEMTWILSCFTYFGQLERMTQFKEKAGLINVFDEIKDKLSTENGPVSDDDIESVRRVSHRYRNARDTASAGLFFYPVLMAADILLYGAKWIPVGEDQEQHIEVARYLAMSINNKFGEVLVIPKAWSKQLELVGLNRGVRIRSLRNPEKKMSKSVSDPAGTILLSDDPEEAAKKVMSATTDSEGLIHWDWEKQPGITNLLQMLSLLSSHSKEEVIAEWEGKSSYGELKTAVAEVVRNFLSDFQRKLSEVNHDQLIQKLEADEAEMNALANTTLERVQQAVGLRPKN